MSFSDLERHFSLTPAERRVLALVARGLTNEEIADALVLAYDTVHVTLRRFSEKTGLSRRRAVVWAVRHEPCCVTGETSV